MKDSRIRHKQVIPIVVAVAAIAAYMIVQQAGYVQAQFIGGIRSGNDVGNQYVTGCSGTCAISGPAVNQQFGTGNVVNSGNVQVTGTGTGTSIHVTTTNQASNAGAAISGPANAGNSGSGTGNQINLAGNSVPFQNSFNQQHSLAGSR